MTASRLLVAFTGGLFAFSGHIHPLDAAPVRDSEIRSQPAPAPIQEEYRNSTAEIDWAGLRFDTDADAMQVWKQLAPTGRDWQRKLSELPGNLPVAHELAVAMIRAGRFSCPANPASSCDGTPKSIPPPLPNASLADPCLRRQLALWSFDQLESEDIPNIRGALREIAKMPPPETELIALALRALPEDDIRGRYELLEIAWKAGHRAVVNRSLGGLDVPHLVDAVVRLRIEGALEILSAQTHRSVYVRAVLDEHQATTARVAAISELAATNGSRDIRALFAALTKHRDCAIAAAAARALEHQGDRSFLPLHLATLQPAAIMRSLCVLAHYEPLQHDGEPSLLPAYVPARGLEIIRTQHAPYGSADKDGDGDRHVERSSKLIKRAAVRLSEEEDIQRALGRCVGTTCTTSEHIFKFGLRQQGQQLVLWRIEVIDRPPCKEQ